MTFKIDDFIVITEQKTEELSERIAVATDIRHEKPINFKFKNKQRNFTAFEGLNLLEKKDKKYYRVISDIFVFIDLIEILKAFNGNKLDTNKDYQIANSFKAKIAQKNQTINLKILFMGFSYALYLDKFECSSLAAKFSKILSRCEAWQE